MTKIHLTEYLTEESLGRVLRAMFGENDVVAQLSIKNECGKRMRVDYAIPSHDLLVEFNGPRHYTQVKTIHRDELLGEYCNEIPDEYLVDVELDEDGEEIEFNDYIPPKATLVSIPFWIQLTPETIPTLFGEYIFKQVVDKGISITSAFPHGFIDKLAVRPYDFCVKGVKRFEQELASFPSQVREQVLNSLRGDPFSQHYFKEESVASRQTEFDNQYFEKYKGKLSKERFLELLPVLIELVVVPFTSDLTFTSKNALFDFIYEQDAAREVIWNIWASVVGSKKEAGLIFDAVDSVHAIS